MHQPFYCITWSTKLFTLDKAFVIFSACSQLLNLLSFILFSILFQCCCQFFSKFLFSIVLVLFSMLFQYYTKNFVSVSVLNDSQILLFSKIVSVFFHICWICSQYISISQNVLTILFCQCFLISLFSVVISKFPSVFVLNCWIMLIISCCLLQDYSFKFVLIITCFQYLSIYLEQCCCSHSNSYEILSKLFVFKY